MITWPVFASIAITDHVANAGDATPSIKHSEKTIRFMIFLSP